MDDQESKEKIIFKLDGVATSLESLPPELRAEAERRLKEARELYASKFPSERLRLNINIKVKTSAAAKRASGSPHTPAIVTIDDGGWPWPILLAIGLALFGGLYLFVPTVTKAVDAGLAAVQRKK